MKAYEFSGKLTPEGKLEVPESLKKVIPGSQALRVLVLIKEPSDSGEMEDWSRVTAEEFFAGYSEADVAYDKV
jgi:hypothetical protein